jgi:hypothetical protein
MTTTYGRQFHEVLQIELEKVDLRRKMVDTDYKPPPVAFDGLTPIEQVRRAALDRDMVGLAFSGGGIRSATINLGVLQGLASLNLLPRIDYLSTVSGGSFIGAWFAAWVRRENSLENVQKQLAPQRVVEADARREPLPTPRIVDDEPEPVYHLRAYSRYLSPRFGLLSADTWTLVAIYVRNLFINMTLLFSVVLAVLLIATRLPVWLFGLDLDSDVPWYRNLNTWLLAAFVVLPMYASYRLTTERLRLRVPCADGNRPTEQSRSWALCHVIWPLLATAVLGTWLFSSDPNAADRLAENWNSIVKEERSYDDPERKDQVSRVIFQSSNRLPVWFADLDVARILRHKEAPHWLPSVVREALQRQGSALDWRGTLVKKLQLPVFTMALMILIPVCRLIVTAVCNRKLFWEWLRVVLGSALIGFLFGLALQAGPFNLPGIASDVVESAESVQVDDPCTLLVCNLDPRTPDERQENMLRGITLGPPLLLVLILLAGYIDVALFARHMSEYEREWRSRVGAYLIMHALSWLLLFGLVYYLPRLPDSVLWQKLGLDKWSAELKVGTIVTWLATTTASVWSGWSGRTGPEKKGPTWIDWLALIGPPVFLMGLIPVLSWLAKICLQQFPTPEAIAQPYLQYTEGGQDVSLVWLGVALVFLGVIILVWWRFIPVNIFSMHSMYCNRLVRCYLGASRRKLSWSQRWDNDNWLPGSGGAPTAAAPPNRLDNPFTGFDDDDDLPLCELRCTAGVAKSSAASGSKQLTYAGPYPLFNATLNHVRGQELGLQDRKAESFVFTPDYCGSRLTGYAPTPATTGEAPNLPLGRVTTISGAAADPNMGVHYSASLTALMTVMNVRLGWWIENPNFGDQWTARGPNFGSWLLKEMLGDTGPQDKFVHLTDGGHFENLGVYELIRRRCRFIISVDAAQDPLDASENLANMIRLVRRDFGIRIEIDTTPLHKDAEGLSRQHATVGTIHYEDVDPLAVTGTFLFMRSSLTGDEPPDIKNFAAEFPAFPHDPTFNQFFDEARFESYRALGYHMARIIFADGLPQE